MRNALLIITLLALTGCAGNIDDPSASGSPRLLGTDENGVKIYGFYWNGYSRCYVVYPQGGASMANNVIRTGKHSTTTSADAVSALPVENQQVVISPEDADLLRRVKAAGIK